MNPNDVASPCINICKIDEPTQRCTGCNRTIEEITRWSRMDNDAKQAVMDAILLRNREARDRQVEPGHDAIAHLTNQPQQKPLGEPPISGSATTYIPSNRSTGSD